MKVPIRVAGSYSFRPAFKPVAIDDPIHWRQRGVALYAAGDRRGAEQAYIRYLSEPVREPALRAVIDAMAAGDLAGADKRIRAFLTQQPGDPVAYRLFGQITLQGEDHAGAETIFRRSIGLVPNFAPLRYELAVALSMQGKFEEALAELEIIFRADLGNTTAYGILRAELLGKLGEFEKATASYKALIEEQPDDASLWVAYGQMLRTIRRPNEAIDAFRRAIMLRPTFGEAWWNLSNLKTAAMTAADVDALRSAIASDQAFADDKFHLRFALARGLEESGSFQASFAEYRLANAARQAMLPAGPRVDTDQFTSRVENLFTRDFIAARRGMGDPSAAPIFILGMPRSGSTLLEQILAQHPAVEGTQELPDLAIIANRLLRSFRNQGEYTQALAQLTADQLHELGSEYLKRTTSRRKTDRPFFIDKQPANWLHIGLIKLILPNARIIDTRRDALACCLSMFRQHFARGADFTYSLERVAAEYRAYHRLMKHFDEVTPGEVYRVHLTNLVADLEGSVRSLLDHLSLPFSSACMTFFESPRAVFTPSSEQVRRPINRESEDLFKNFEPYLGELKAILGDLAKQSTAPPT